MLKWVLIALGALIVFQYIQRSKSSASSGGFLSGGSKGGSGITGFVDSLSGLTNSVGKLFGNSGAKESSYSDDSLISPSW